MRFRTALAVALGAALWIAPQAGAATSDGVSYPCTASFAKDVAIASGFVETVNGETEGAFASPRFWAAEQVSCADFDGDGSDEMAFALGSMGGTDPWAFFEIPGGRAPGATFAFPTIEWTGRYPNHALELVAFEGRPAIRDSRRLFRRRDAHCCPTGGTAIRVVGFRDGGYAVLATEVLEPPGLHPARLSAGSARNAVAQFLGRRYRGAWDGRSGGSLTCFRKLGLNARRCEVVFSIGDISYFGRILVKLFERGPGDRYARLAFRLTRFNEYCAVLELPPRRCIRPEHGRTSVRL